MSKKEGKHNGLTCIFIFMLFLFYFFYFGFYFYSFDFDKNLSKKNSEKTTGHTHLNDSSDFKYIK